MLFVAILGLLLFGNWFLTETLIYFPVNLVSRLTNFGWWGLAVVGIMFLAWCIGDD